MSLNMYLLQGGELPTGSRAHANAAAPNSPFHIWKSEVLTLSAWWFRRPGKHGALSTVGSLDEVPECIMGKLSYWWNEGETVAGAADMLTFMTEGYVREKRATADTVGLKAALRARMAQ